TISVAKAMIGTVADIAAAFRSSRPASCIARQGDQFPNGGIHRCTASPRHQRTSRSARRAERVCWARVHVGVSGVRQQRSGRSDMSVNRGGPNPLQHAVAQSTRELWMLFVVGGIVLLLLGILAILIPPLATLTFTLVIGWLFLISGIVGLVTTFM